MTDHTEANWRLLRHVYSGWVEMKRGRLQNVRLPQRHFEALTLAARTKKLGRRPRSDDDSLIRAIGNWLYSKEYGAWRNTDRGRPYHSNNKELWGAFVAASVDYSLQKAIDTAG